MTLRPLPVKARWLMSSLVDKLGSATVRLYAAVVELVEQSSRAGEAAGPTRLGLARVALAVLCGDFHDRRSSSPRPKLDLVEALRRVPQHASVSWEIDGLVQRSIAGEFADDMPTMRPDAGSRPGRMPSVEATPDPINLAPNEWRIFVWLYRYVELYGMPPLHREMADGLGITTVAVADLLRRLEAKGAVATVGGRRGWIPVRAP